MPAPPLRYARTGDGVDIAYVDAGQGYPVVFVPIVPISHIQAAWDLFCHQPLADRFRYIAYDPRGCGLSDRRANDDYSLAAMLRDLEAVLARAGIDRFAAHSGGAGVPILLAAAAAWPDRITHLTAIDGWACLDAYPTLAADRAALALRDVDWVIYSETVANVIAGFRGDLARQFGSLIRSCADRDTFIRGFDESSRYDARTLLRMINQPAQIIETLPRRSYVPEQAASDLAAALSNARLVISNDPNWGNLPDLLENFICGSERSPRGAGEQNGHHQPLSEREREVIALIAAGKTNVQTAAELVIAEATVARHVHNILEKLGMSRRSEAAAWWATNGNGRGD